MNPIITIRRAGTEDAEDLLLLSRNTFFEAFAHLNEPQNMEAYAAVQFTHETIFSQLQNSGSQFYFAETDRQITGYIKLNQGEAQTEFRDEQGLEIERIYVPGAYQGKQIGKQLIEFAIDEALHLKLNKIWLGVWEHNLRAVKFYEKFGFKIFDSHEFMLGNDRQVDLLMKKILIPA